MPYLQKQLVPVQFGGGINTKVDPKQLQAGQLLTLENGVFAKKGQISKRFGYDQLANTIEGGGTIKAGVELTTFKDELILFDGTSIYSYLSATGNWSNRGTAISVVTEDRDIIRRSDAQQLNPDMAALNGVEVYAWEDSRGGVYYSVLDTATKAFVVSGVQVSSSGQQPKCMAFANQILILYSNGTTTLSYKALSPLNPSVLQPAVTVLTDGFNGVNGYPYDAAVIAGNLYIAYISSTPNTVVKYLFIDGNLALHAAKIADPTPLQFLSNHGSLSIQGDPSGNIWIVRATNSSPVLVIYNSTGAQILAPVYLVTLNPPTGVFSFVIPTLAMVPTANGMTIFAEWQGSANAYDQRVTYDTITPAGGSTTPRSGISGTGPLYGVGLASKPWVTGGNLFVNGAYQSTLQATDFVFYVPPVGGPVIVGKMTPSIGGGLSTNGMVPETVNVAPNVYKVANLQAGKLISEANTLFSLLGVNSTKLTFDPHATFGNATLGNTLLIAGGTLQGYDGSSTTELGFHIYPEHVSSSITAGTGHIPPGTYQYIVEWEWTDNNGQIYRSAPSAPITVVTTSAGGSDVTLTIGTLYLTNKTKVSCVVYRTANAGSIFHRVSSTVAPTITDPTVNNVSFVDTLTDTAAAANEINYTTGGILNNIAPPANSILATYNNRAFLAGMSDKLLIWYSQVVQNGNNASTIPPQFCQELTIACDPRGGPITGLAVLNQVLVIFKSSQIFSLAGNGPDATGANNDFGDPSLVTSDVGCINDNSIVVMPEGVMFASAKGIYLLNQSMTLEYIGAPVEAYNNLTISAAVLSAQDTQVIFTTTSGRALVYDYYFKQWSTWTNHYAAGCAITNSLFAFATPAGLVYRQNRSRFTDNGSPIYLSWTLPNLSFAGLQGFQRVFRCFLLGTYKGLHKLAVQVAYDDNDSYESTATIVPTSPSNWGGDTRWGLSSPWGGAYTIYQHRVDLKRQKCTSIRLNVSDTQSGAYNEGYAISSVVFEVGVLPGGNRLPSTQVYGAQ